MVSRRIRLRACKQLFVFCVAIAVVLLPWWRAELTRGDERNIARWARTRFWELSTLRIFLRARDEITALCS